MLGGEVFERFLEQAPISVMTRAALENVLAPDKLDAVFRRAACQQYERELLFSTVVDLMSLVVCRVHPSIHAAFQQRKAAIPVSLKAVYDKLNHVEPQTSRELVRHTAGEAAELIGNLQGGCRPLLPGYRVRILDGNHLQGTDHRIQELRSTGGGALPGLCLAVLDPEHGTICDAIPCEDAHTQECRLLDPILENVQPRDVFLADRHFCTSHFLFGLRERQGGFVIRQHAGHLRWQLIGRRKRCGRMETGTVYEQAMHITHPETEAALPLRRITVVLDEPTRDGDSEIHMLTNLPSRAAGAVRVADLYRSRWRLETAFQEMTEHLRCELNTLGHPPAALFAFCTAAACYNLFAVILAALRSTRCEAVIAEEVSHFYLTEELSGTYRGMMIALPPAHWESFQSLTPRQLAQQLRAWAQSVDLSPYQKHRRAPKTRRTRPSAPRQHTATARLLNARKAKPLKHTE